MYRLDNRSMIANWQNCRKRCRTATHFRKLLDRVSVSTMEVRSVPHDCDAARLPFNGHTASFQSWRRPRRLVRMDQCVIFSKSHSHRDIVTAPLSHHHYHHHHDADDIFLLDHNASSSCPPSSSTADSSRAGLLAASRSGQASVLRAVAASSCYDCFATSHGFSSHQLPSRRSNDVSVVIDSP